jgi:hypothetical protein
VVVILVTVGDSHTLVWLGFDDLAYFEPDQHSSLENAYEVWTHALPDGPRGLAFAVETSGRGVAFIALMEKEIRGWRPDLLTGHGSMDINVERNRFVEPANLWSL